MCLEDTSVSNVRVVFSLNPGKWQGLFSKELLLVAVKWHEDTNNSSFQNYMYPHQAFNRWASRHPVDGHILNKIILFFFLCGPINCSFEQAL